MTDAPDVFLPHYLPYLLRQADQTLSGPFYAVLTRYEISRSEWRVLSVLHERGELGVVELASAALSPQPTVTHALRRLEKRGLVLRTLGTQDKRQRFNSVTPAGATLARTLLAEASRLQSEALEHAGDLSELTAGLKRLTATVESHIKAQADGQSATQSVGVQQAG